MEKIQKVVALLTTMAVTLTADQQKQLEEVIKTEYVPAEDAAKVATELDEVKKQLEQRSKDLEKLGRENKSEELKKQLDELSAKYKQETEELTEKLRTQEQDHAAEKLFGNYNFASERVKQSVLAEFKGKGFKYEGGEFVGGKEYLEGLMKSEPDAFAKETDKPAGLFMGGTRSSAPADESTNARAQIFSGFGLKNE